MPIARPGSEVGDDRVRHHDRAPVRGADDHARIVDARDLALEAQAARGAILPNGDLAVDGSAIVSLPLTAYAQLVAPAGAGRSARLAFANIYATDWLPFTMRQPTTVPFALMANARPNPSGVMSTTVQSVAIAWAARARRCPPAPPRSA
jgi:hypothetical protein